MPSSLYCHSLFPDLNLVFNSKKILVGDSSMKFISANLENLRALYVSELQHLHSAETQITDALPKMIEKATDPQLKQGLETHLQETRGHVARLEQILQRSAGKVDSKKNKGIAALITEGEDIITDAKPEALRDAGIIAAAQKVEHYEMAAYGTVRTWAEILGLSDQADLLERTLDEEKHADAVLTQIADTANTRADRAA
ncbi:MAG TPA: ferritin-like domain-containing protein [Candidatus Sulfotelmatobacter sp.]|nr:ferritin-like domain-containing protein [Candidatus Sulfotelmatobacter sp.]